MALPLAGCSGGAGGASATPTPSGPTFANPIKSQGQDPWVIKDGDRYLLAESRDGGIWLTVSPKDDLTGIDSGTAHRIWASPVDGPDSQDVWAPELHHIDGHWYVYFAATTADKNNANHRMFVLESSTDDPLSTYTDKGRIADAAGRWAIDGTRFSWKGQDYFVWSGWPGGTDGRQNLYIARMTSPTTLAGTGVLLSEPTLSWETEGNPIEEGPEALRARREAVPRVLGERQLDRQLLPRDAAPHGSRPARSEVLDEVAEAGLRRERGCGQPRSRVVHGLTGREAGLDRLPLGSGGGCGLGPSDRYPALHLERRRQPALRAAGRARSAAGRAERPDHRLKHPDAVGQRASVHIDGLHCSQRHCIRPRKPG